LSVGINLNAGMNVEIFDLATLNYEKSNIIGYEWLIAQSPTKPKVTTGDVTNIQSTTASCSGNVTADGGQAVTDRGICWSTSQNPTIENSKTSGGTGTGTFTGNLTGLTANTSYYVRAYATNSEGTAYGVEKAFTTLTEDTDFAVTTGAVTNITTNSASCSGNVTAQDAASVTARGLCWSTSQSPTTADSKTSNGTGTGTFSGALTGLAPNTTYYVRAYATHSEGTAYGEQRAFQTLEEEELSGTFTDNRDGKTYRYVKIGSQYWMAENLAYLPYDLPFVAPNTIWLSDSPLYYVYDYNREYVEEAKATTNYQKYGVLYNWPAAMNGASSSDANPSGVQGVCPSGWHLPSYAEWTEMSEWIGTAWSKAKLQVITWGGRDTYGFSARPGGLFYVNVDSGLSAFNHIGANAYWWTSTEEDPFPKNEPTCIYLSYYLTYVANQRIARECGLSVRCIRD